MKMPTLNQRLSPATPFAMYSFPSDTQMLKT